MSFNQIVVLGSNPEQTERRLHYKGRNGYGRMAGLRLTEGVESYLLNPLKTTGTITGACQMEFPRDPEHLEQIASVFTDAAQFERERTGRKRHQMALAFVRQERGGLGAMAILQFGSHERLLSADVLKRLRKAITAWCASTEEGRRVYGYAGGDLNIGDVNSHDGFSDETLVTLLAQQGIFDARVLELVDCDGVVSFDYCLADEVDEEDEPEGAQLFRNFYTCPNCGHDWEDVWSAQCDDDCPSCGKRHISPHASQDAGQDDLSPLQECAKLISAAIEKDGPGTADHIEYEQLLGKYHEQPFDAVWYEFRDALREQEARAQGK